MSIPFRNNLEQNDRVFDTVSKRQGKVKWTPRSESQRRTSVVFDGQQAPQYLDVMQLRLITDGHTPESVPPVDGDPPAETPVRPERRTAAVATGPTVLDTLRAQRDQNVTEMTALEKRFRGIKAENERIEKAIAVLSEQ